MADIFISYKREDRQVAERLSISLEQLGFNVWWDFQILSGQQFRRVIEKVIDQCAVAVVLWSELARESTFVIDEASYAREQNKLCPARIDDCRLPMGFGGDHVVDLRAWDGQMNHEGLQDLLRALEAKTGKAPRLGARAREGDDVARFAEMEAFKAAQAAENLSALRAFLRDYPKGAFSAFVKAQVEELHAHAPKVAAPAGGPPLAVDAPRHAPPLPPAPPPRYLQAPQPKRPPWPALAVGGALAIAVLALVVALRPWAPQQPPPAPIDEQARDVDAEIEAARLEERERAKQEIATRERQLREQGESAEAARRQAEQEAARRQGEQEQADRNAWGAAQRANSVAGYERYLSAYPSGLYSADARTARQRLAAAASAPPQVVTATPAAYDLAQLHPDVRRAVEQARDAERRANAAAARARQAAASAQDAARRARNGEAGYRAETLTWGEPSNTGRYETAFANGARNGYGVRTLTAGSAVGDVYAGQWSGGTIAGVGVFSFAQNPNNSANALRYEGEWANGLRNGVGVGHWSDGGRYAGGYREDLKTGPGVFYFADGRRHEGEFASGQYNGAGVFWDAQGRVVQAGAWSNNTLSQALSR